MEDNDDDAELVGMLLARGAPGVYDLVRAGRLSDALARIATEPFDAVMCDLGLPDSMGLGSVQAIAVSAPSLPLVVLTGLRDEQMGREAIKHGAQDYLVKGESDGAMIGRTLRYAIERKHLETGLREANESLERRVGERTAELQAANQKLQASETRFRELTELASDWYWEQDENFRFTWFSRPLEGITRTANTEHIGKTRWELAALGVTEAQWDDHRRTLEAHLPFRDFEFRLPGSGGKLRDVSVSGLPIFDKNRQFRGYRGVGHDITHRKRAEAALARQKDLYAVLSETNQMIVRCNSREELFAGVCRIAVDYGHFRFAWIGLLDEQGKWVNPVARYGSDTGYGEQLRTSTDEADPAGRGVVGQAVRAGSRKVSNDMLNDPATAPWHEAARQTGVAAVGAFPLHLRGAVAGVLVLYGPEPGFFDDDLLPTLDEIAIDVSFALDNLEREAERKRAEESLAEAEAQFRGLVEQSIAGIYIVQDGKFAYVNPRFAQILGYISAEELVGLKAADVIAPQDRATNLENRQWLFESEARSANYTFAALKNDGTSVEVGIHGTKATYRGRPAIIGLMQDISEKKRAEEQISHYISQLEKTLMGTVNVATTLSEMRDPYTAGHERRVAEIAVAIGAELGLEKRRLEGLRVAGYLHDIGKITIPAEILSKPGKLSAIEYKLIQGHPRASYDVLKNVEFPWPVATIALQHHERIDGTGYPDGLKGDEIALEARILAVADTVEAMSSHRPYRPGLGIDAALAEIERGRGTSYDEEVAGACMRLFRDKGYVIPDPVQA